jgi:aspartokinase
LAGYLLRWGITALLALADANINILSISTSMSSVSCVFDQSRLDGAIAALKETFQLS